VGCNNERWLETLRHAGQVFGRTLNIVYVCLLRRSHARKYLDSRTAGASCDGRAANVRVPGRSGMCCAGLASPMEYTVIAAFLLAVVAGSFAAVILGGYEIARLIAFIL